MLSLKKVVDVRTLDEQIYDTEVQGIYHPSLQTYHNLKQQNRNDNQKQELWVSIK